MASTRHTIMVVDDEADVVKSVKDLLRLDYRVLGATTAVEAMRLLNQEEVHVVMTDQRMPEMTGVELLANIRGQYPHAVRLLFTGYADIHAVIDAINQGNVYRYIAKPWDPDELQSVIREACERYDLIVSHEELLQELQQTNKQLKDVNTQLTQADQLKSAFIRVASHELRTPLTILLGVADLAKRDQAVPPSVHASLSRIHHAAERLQRLIDQIVTMLSTQQFEQMLQRKPVDVAATLRSAADDVRPFVELRHEDFILDLSDDLGTMNIDAEKVRDSVNHLLLNAVKFTADYGRITLTAWRDEAHKLVIRVSDTGCGIDENCQPQLFHPFFTQMDVSKHSSGIFEHGRRGLGLGLSVVKAFVELHGGSVTVQSEVGKGSTFTLTIPDAAEGVPAESTELRVALDIT